MKQNVYCVNKASHDVSDAERFGDVIFLTEGLISRYNTNNMYRTFLPVMENSQPDDWILLTGMTVLNVICCSIFVLMHNRLNLLIHRSEDNSYVSRILDFSGIEDKPVAEILKTLKED